MFLCFMFLCFHVSSLSFRVLPAFQQSNVIYQFLCHCDSWYVSRASQTLQDRIKQHISKSIRNTAAYSQTRSQPNRHCKSSTQQVPSTQSLSCDSAIGLHLLRNLICAQNYDDKQFSILAKVHSPFIRLRSHFHQNPILCGRKEFVYNLMLLSH